MRLYVSRLYDIVLWRWDRHFGHMLREDFHIGLVLQSVGALQHKTSAAERSNTRRARSGGTASAGERRSAPTQDERGARVSRAPRSLTSVGAPILRRVRRPH